MENQNTQKQLSKIEVNNEEVNWSISANDLLFDLKCLMKEYYAATFSDGGNALKICFKNGQSFLLSVKAYS